MQNATKQELVELTSLVIKALEEMSAAITHLEERVSLMENKGCCRENGE